MLRYPFLVSALFILAFPLVATAEVPTPGLKKTFKFPDLAMLCGSGNAFELGECMSAEYRKARKYLKDLERDISADMEPNERKVFFSVSKTWSTFVEASCQFDSYGASGNSSGAIYAACELNYALARIRQIEKFKYCSSTDACGRPIYLYTIISPITYGSP